MLKYVWFQLFSRTFPLCAGRNSIWNWWKIVLRSINNIHYFYYRVILVNPYIYKAVEFMENMISFLEIRSFTSSKYEYCQLMTFFPARMIHNEGRIYYIPKKYNHLGVCTKERFSFTYSRKIVCLTSHVNTLISVTNQLHFFLHFPQKTNCDIVPSSAPTFYNSRSFQKRDINIKISCTWNCNQSHLKYWFIVGSSFLCPFIFAILVNVKSVEVAFRVLTLLELDQMGRIAA